MKKYTYQLLRNVFCLACLFLLYPLSALAHKPSDSYMSFQLREEQQDFSLRWDIALRDLDFALNLDKNNSGDLSWGEVQSAEAEITSFALQHLKVKTNTPQGDTCSLHAKQSAQLDHHSDGTYIVLWLTGTCQHSISKGIFVDYRLFFDLDPTHRGLAQWSNEEKSLGSVIFKPQAPATLLTVKEQSLAEVTVDYIKDGVWHIWIGIDHILFLISLLLPAVMIRNKQEWTGVEKLPSTIKDIVKVVTAFTVAHSITLTLASLQVVSLPSMWVESAIAFSVVVAALNNLKGAVHSKRWVMAFGFGLLHGFGFASVLADLGLPKHLLAVALLSFNVGVELGQLSIVIAVMPLAFLIRNTRFYKVGVLQCGSLLVALIAAVWTVERLTGLKYLPF